MKRIAPVLLFFACVFVCVSCGGGGGGKPGVTLHVAVWKPENPASWDEAIAEFEKGHPEIRVELDIAPNSSTQFHDLLTQRLRNRDTGLDAFLMDVVWPPEFAAAGWAMPLDDRFPEEERKKFFAGAIDAVTYRGFVRMDSTSMMQGTGMTIYGVPFNTDAGLLYYRKDLLGGIRAEPPATWTELLDDVDAVRAAGGKGDLAGYSGQFARYEGLICNMMEIVRSRGGRLEDPASPDTKEAIRFVRDRVIGHAAPRGVLTYQEQESLDLFRHGDAVFLRSWPYAWSLLNADDSPVAGKIGIAPLPALTADAGASSGIDRTPHSVSALGGWSWGVHTASKHPDEAWAFVEFMTSEAMQKHFAVNDGKAPARRALYEDPDVLAANPSFRDLRAVFEAAVPRPKTPQYARVSGILQRSLHEAIADPGSDVDALMEKAAEEIEPLEPSPGDDVPLIPYGIGH